MGELELVVQVKYDFESVDVINKISAYRESREKTGTKGSVPGSRQELPGKQGNLAITS